jgi:hypothetical protein
MVPRLMPAKLWPPSVADVLWMARWWGKGLLVMRGYHRCCFVTLTIFGDDLLFSLPLILVSYSLSKVVVRLAEPAASRCVR